MSFITSALAAAAAAAVGVGSDTPWDPGGGDSSFMLNQMGRRGGGGKVSRKRRDSATKQENIQRKGTEERFTNENIAFHKSSY